MLAATQASNAESRRSFEEAFAWAKEQYGQQRADRSPYMTAGKSALDMWTNLLGLQPTLVGPGSGGTGPGAGGGSLFDLGTSSSAPGGPGAPGAPGAPPGSSGGYGGYYAPPPPVAPPTDVSKPLFGGPTYGRQLPVMKVPYSGIDLSTGKPITR